ncbi:aldo/keto reductase family protein [Nodosilinea sp. E11]|uniref:aldo/keto reductase family protein n=1 Tax=Nodosilinea sp. E11 TaxID=3037479 RepID=UPI00293427E0|nr:aldo/keto reductase family protein [Nodosilinea sp. E11]WOD41922.1 aldo/keto reductase family protein [Nodosilinea sp. E11]
MKYRQLGDSDLTVSEIALGSWLTYGGGVERQQAEACVHKAFEVGINFIDTANVYGRGAAESFLGEVLRGRDRSSYVLATKVFFPMSPSDQGLSAAQIYKQIDASLQRLGTDYVDLYQCHRFDPKTPLEETMAALSDIVHQGKARYIGFSEWQPTQIQAALDLANTEKFVSSQPQYSMLWRQPQAEVFPLCAANGIGQIVWSPLAQGVLTGKYKPGASPPADSRAANDQMNGFMDEVRRDRVLSAVQNLQPIAQRLNLSMAQLALAWILQDERVTAAIVGASRPEQLTDNAAASGVHLSPEVLQEIDQVLSPALPQPTER